MSRVFIFILNIIRTTLWLGVVMPISIAAGILAGTAAAIGYLIRWEDPGWHPLHPFRSVRFVGPPDDVQPPVRVDE